MDDEIYAYWSGLSLQSFYCAFCALGDIGTKFDRAYRYNAWWLAGVRHVKRDQIPGISLHKLIRDP